MMALYALTAIAARAKNTLTAIAPADSERAAEFTLVAERDGQRWQEQRRACRGQDQNWYVDN